MMAPEAVGRGVWWLAAGALALMAVRLALGQAAAEGRAAAPEGAKPAAQGTPDITFVEQKDDEAPGQGQPAANPFGAGPAGVSRQDGVPGYIELSNGLKVPGYIYTTRAKRLKIFNLKREMYEYVPVPALKRIETIIEWERVDPEWRFKEAGNPEKVYTGRKYPVRMHGWRLTLRNDHVIEGHILGQPLYVEHNGKAEAFILHKRDKGPIGTDLKDLIYIKRVEFDAGAYNQAVDELKAKAEGAGAGKGTGPESPAPKAGGN